MMRTKKDDVLLSPALLAPFHCVCYANLKKYTFDHHFSFPVLPSKWNMSSSEPPDPETLEAVEKYIATATPDQRGFFLIRSDNTVHPLAALLESPQDPVCFSRPFWTQLLMISVSVWLLEFLPYISRTTFTEPLDISFSSLSCSFAIFDHSSFI